jgi:GAF domain-containing protein
MLVDVSDLKRARRALSSTRDVLAAQVRTLTRLHALSMFLGSGFDLRIGLQAVVDTFAELHEADHGLLTLYDEASGLLFPAASHGFASETLLVLGQIGPGLPANVVGRAFTTGQRAVVEDIDADLQFAPARPIARMAGFRAVHSVPILRRSGGTIGVLSAFFAASRVPTDAERQIADICALHAADAVEAARSRQTLQETEARFRHMADHAPALIWVRNRRL